MLIAATLYYLIASSVLMVGQSYLERRFGRGFGARSDTAKTEVAKGLSAGELVKLAVGAIDGKGGGRPEMAQGRGTKREGVAAALDAVRESIRGSLA